MTTSTQPMAATPPHARKAMAWIGGTLLVLGLTACGSKHDATGDKAVVAEPAGQAAPGGAAAGGGIGSAGNAAYTSEALGGYLGEPGADPTGRAFTLDKVTFDSASSTLGKDADSVIADVAGVLAKYPKADVTVTSYADPQGDAASNKKLAAARAVAVKNALAKHGVAAARLKTDVVG
jgi:outer membrane protein OmpA-like peptidoglycan-associated protein